MKIRMKTITYFKNKISLLLLTFVGLLIFANLSMAQVPISKVTYICKTNLKSGRILDGMTSLYFNDQKSLFVHSDVPAENQYIENGQATVFKKGDSEGYPVYTNYKERRLYYKSYYGSPKELFIFKEEIPDIKWTITGQTKQIDRLSCTKAFGGFGGRIYDVWFTPDIPVSFGPYKLHGLPGLILEAKSRDKMVSYEFQSYETRTDSPPPIIKPQIGREVTMEEFERFIINKLIMVESLLNGDGSITNNDPHPDYTIEKNKFVIIAPYKKRRREGKN